MKLHHIGVVVDQLRSAEERYQADGFRVVVSERKDPHQKVVISVVQSDAVRVELLVPLSDDSPISAFQNAGGGFHHVCFMVDSLADTGAFFGYALEFRQISKPTPSIFDGRLVAFFLSKQGTLVELIES